MQIFGIVLSTADKWLLGICMTLIITFITIRFKIYLTSHQCFIKAAQDFRTQFIEVQRMLNQTFEVTAPNGTRVKAILGSHIVAHEKAMLAFRPYISKRKRRSFDKAWKEYYSQKNEYADCLTDYESIHFTPSIDHPKHENDLRKLALSRIEKLLSFAPCK
jgi:hypothetical protein